MNDYDIYHLGVSGGKDSTAVLLWAVYESGLPLDRLNVTFCDTDNEDSLTYAYLDMLTKHVFPIRRIDTEGFFNLAQPKRRFPSRKARFCTQFLKVIPSSRHIMELSKQGRVLCLNGVRQAEGHNANDRGTVGTFNHDETLGVDIFRPIYEWSLQDVWAIHKRYLQIELVLSLVESDPTLIPEHKQLLLSRLQKHKIARNPIYDMGASRVGCFPCINSKKAEIRAMAKFRPGRIDFIEDQETNVGKDSNVGYSSFFARKTVPEQLRSRTIQTTSGETMQVATIRDVVTWAQTAWGGKQFTFDFDQVGESCDLRGMCE
jgi:3'-phosphoadenosine 5'-phosphosulfate sulfotransferase (PAPS reductase)/FAD synthetase